MDKGLITHHICQIRCSLRMKRTPDKPSPFCAVFFVAGVIQPCLLGNIFHSVFHDPSGKEGLQLWRSITGPLTLCVAFTHVN